MPSLYDFSRKISSLTKEKKYPEALSCFKAEKGAFNKEQIAHNEYIVSDILSCLRRSHNLDAGFKFLEIYGITIDANSKPRILNAYGWLLWAKYKTENDNAFDVDSIQDDFLEEDELLTPDPGLFYNKNELVTKIEQLIPLLLGDDSVFTQTLISNLFSIVLKSEKKKPNPNWKLINNFCDKFDPNLLSIDCATIEVTRKGKTKEMELASDKENWYAYKTKALLKLGLWSACFDLSKEALEVLDSFHYSNDVWFARRIALAKKNMGNLPEAIQELEAILSKKKEWFVQKELAELYFENKQTDKSLQYALAAMNNYGPLEFKVELLFLLSGILQ